ncbi:unnamed protein product, partial [Mesorhabditis spiculigera]
MTGGERFLECKCFNIFAETGPALKKNCLQKKEECCLLLPKLRSRVSDLVHPIRSPGFVSISAVIPVFDLVRPGFTDQR